MRSTIIKLILFLFSVPLYSAKLELVDVNIIDSETTYFLTMKFNARAEYIVAEVYEPPSITVTFPKATWPKGDFARRVMTDPLYQYSLKSTRGSLGRKALELKLDFFSNTKMSINRSGESEVIISWPKFKSEGKAVVQDLLDEDVLISDVMNQRVSLSFSEAYLDEVVRLLIGTYGLNLVFLDTFDEGFNPINIQLDGVTLGTALNVILKVNGYEWFLDEKIIIVKNREDTIQGELETRIYELKFADAQVIGNALSNGILTEKGNNVGFSTGIGGESSFSDRIMVTDRTSNFTYIEQVIKELDKLTQQIHISVKFIETTLSTEERLGINWTLRADLLGPAVKDELEETIDIGKWKSLSIAQLTTPLFMSVLDLLSSDNNTKLLQEPQVTTFNNSMASINVGTSIPILVPQAEGGVFGVNPYTFQQQNVNISLEVTPRINSDGLISMAINAQIQAIIGYVGPDADRPIISTRSTNTNVRVADGRTLLIGGLIFDDENNARGKLPLLGSIPILGKLFTTSTKKTDQRELLIFITPSIVS